MSTQKKDTNNEFLSIETQDDQSKELLKFLKILWKKRRTIIWTVIVFTAFGLFVAIYSPVEYTASTIMVPQIKSGSSGLGSLSGFAAMAGINLNSLSNDGFELSPIMYPQIVKSISFQKEIMYSPLKWKDIEDSVSLLDYSSNYSNPGPLSVIKKYTIGIVGVLTNLIKGEKQENDELFTKSEDGLVYITEAEKNLRGSLTNQISLVVNTRDGYITLTAKAPEAKVAAQIAYKAQKLLQKIVTEYKIDRAKQNKIFIEGLYKEKKAEYDTAKIELAMYMSSNQNIVSAIEKTKLEGLTGVHQLALTVFTNIAQQLENAKIKIKEDTPIFSIIEPVSVPFERSGPRRKIILLMYVFVGFIIGSGFVFLNSFYIYIKHIWKDEE
ncbi:Wzz/FepE/Etk N-terminal domain-containing protein [Bacteroidota bacterium]